MNIPGDTPQSEKSQSPDVSPDTKSSGGAVIILFFIFGLAVSMVLGWVIFPTLLYSKKTQPVDFNHALHVAEVDNGCQSCHFYRDDGTFSGIPTLETCVECHEDVLGETEEEALVGPVPAPVRAHVGQGERLGVLQPPLAEGGHGRQENQCPRCQQRLCPI